MKLLKKITHTFKRNRAPAGARDELDFVRNFSYASDEERRIMKICRPYSQTTYENIFALLRATQYLIRHGIEGCFVECGVWKGGSVMAMALMADTLKESRDIFLFDTFNGMPAGGALDVDLDGHDERWYREKSDAYIHAGSGAGWNAVSQQEVEKNLSTIPETRQRFHCVPGKVEDTLARHAPKKIALLRLDTDFYASTKHALTQLFPRVTAGGIVIVDDYGHFLGARTAFDEYVQENDIRMFMNRIDYTAILGVKC